MSLLDKVWERVAREGAGTATPDPPSTEPAPGRMTPEGTPFPEDSPYRDLDKIRARVKQHIEDCSKVRWSFERNWFQAVLYYIGNQWITWDARGQRWREKKLARKWVPKPVTNVFASTVDTIVAAVQSFKVLPSVWPASEDADAMATTDVADRLIPVIEEEVDIERIREAAANWVVLNGDAFLFPFYDHADTSLGTREIPLYGCELCGQPSTPAEIEEAQACPNCAGPAPMMPAMDPMTGQPLTQTLPVGKLCVDVCSPLEVYVNQDVLKIKDHRKFAKVRSYSLDTIKATWKETGKGVASDRAGAGSKTAQYFMESLAQISEHGGYAAGRSGVDRATLTQYVELPSDDFPEGLVVTVASDDTVLEVGPSPFFDAVPPAETPGQPLQAAESKHHYCPLVHIPYRRVPGRLYSKTPASDLLPKQDQLNRLESLIETAIMRGVYSTWLLPVGSSITETSGEPGQKIRWTPSGTGGAKPEVITQQPLPPSLMEWRSMLLQDFEELGGTFDAMKGKIPSGVSAGYAIQLLAERSYGRFAPVFASWEQGFVDLYTILIKIARLYMTEARVRRIKGESGQWEIQKFKGADLAGSVLVKVEGGASRPRSKLAEQALVESLASIGVITPGDPGQKVALAEMFGMGHIVGGLDEDKRCAAKEWDSFLLLEQTALQTGQVNPALAPKVRLVVDNHMMHILDHQKRAKTDRYLQVNPQLQMIWERHIMDHNMAMMELQGGGQPPPDASKTKGHNPNPQGDNQHAKPAGSKDNEQSDQTMNVVRRGGNTTMGGSGV